MEWRMNTLASFQGKLLWQGKNIESFSSKIWSIRFFFSFTADLFFSKRDSINTFL